MKQFAIFGNPVAHSKSPLMHNLAFKGVGFDGCYGRYRLEDGTKLKEKFLSLGLSGINITVPHKEAAFEACDQLDSFAKSVGAVNTIVNIDGKLHGFNTDAPGLLRVIKESNQPQKILLLGAGGTAKAVAPMLKKEGFSLMVANRSTKRLESFSAQGIATCSYDELSVEPYDLVINMTSAGLCDDSLPLQGQKLTALFKKAKGAIDIIYGKQTPFLELAKECNLATKDGSDMLLYQGIIAFEHFTNYRYCFEEIKPHMQQAFIY